MIDWTAINSPVNEKEAIKAAKQWCNSALLQIDEKLSKEQITFKQTLYLQFAGYLLRAQDELPREQWLAANLGMSTIEFQVEGWNELCRNRYRVSFALLRPIFEASIYTMACAVVPSFVEQWYNNQLKRGTIQNIFKALLPKMGEGWIQALKKKWDMLNEVAHANLFPSQAVWVRANSVSGLEAPAIPVFGGIFKEETARYLSSLYCEISKDALVAQGLCIVAPREDYPLWYQNHDRVVLENQGI
jgi:hypothetical protein